jgi:hypothetical protein
MFRVFTKIILFVSSFSIYLACTKPSDPAEPTGPPPIDTTTTPPTVTPAFKGQNRWQCEVDGKLYQGTVDTSFFSFINVTNTHPDTSFIVLGTADDKRSNIYFWVSANRYFHAEASNYNGRFNLIFDTLSSRYAEADKSKQQDIQLKMDTFGVDGVSATFSGKIRLRRAGNVSVDTFYTVTNGKLSAGFGKGKSEPKMFSFNAITTPVSTLAHAGYFHSGQLLANTLVMDGITLDGISYAPFRLAIRTGGTVKTGLYRSRDGDVLISFNERFVWITDQTGDATVNIQTVNGNIVSGIFSGTTQSGNPITEARFQCRIKDYRPQIDAPDRWSMNLDQGLYRYEMFAGNTTSAILSSISGIPTLAIQGESDNGASSFKLMLKCYSGITAGNYEYNNPLSSRLLELVQFSSPIRLAYGSYNNFDLKNIGYYCKIDRIDAVKVEGRILLLNGPNGTIDPANEIVKGKFSARF